MKIRPLDWPAVLVRCEPEWALVATAPVQRRGRARHAANVYHELCFRENQLVSKREEVQA